MRGGLGFPFSALGAVCYKRQLPADYNIDNLTETGIYISNNGQDTYVVYRISDGLIYQTKHHVNEICQRVYWYGSGWGNWYRNDNYGTSSLSELASALGDLHGVRTGSITLTSDNKAAARAGFQTWFESQAIVAGTYVLSIAVGASMWGLGCKHNNDNGHFIFGSYWTSNLGKSVTISGGTWTWED